MLIFFQKGKKTICNDQLSSKFNIVQIIDGQNTTNDFFFRVF